MYLMSKLSIFLKTKFSIIDNLKSEKKGNYYYCSKIPSIDTFFVNQETKSLDVSFKILYWTRFQLAIKN
jgi:hypothetical protein